MEQFREAPRLAVTINRHTKTGSSKHEKDDRDHTADPSRFVLGWDNRDKKRRLGELIDQLQQSIDRSTRRIEGFDTQLRALAGESQAIEQCLQVSSFEEIDDRSHFQAMELLKQEKAALESSN